MQKEWSTRDPLTPDQSNVQSFSLVDSKDVVLTPLHTKLGLLKNFVEALNRDNASFEFFHSKFSVLSDVYIRAIVFNIAQICELMKDFFGQA